jgi:hypothetical protein
MIADFGFLIMIACAVFYYRLGEHEYSSGTLLAAVSICLWLMSDFLLGLGLLGHILLQAALFVALWAWNIARKDK